jgi:glycosyltransferase involved in cell wall biosynthesis
MRKPRLLCLMHLPPPVHGVTVVNQRVVTSAAVAARIDLDVVPLRFAPSIDDLGRISPGKLVRAAATGLAIAGRLVVRRPDALYLTMSPHGGALYRDCAYAALARLAGVPRIYHLHAHGIARTLDSGWRRRLGRWVFDGAWVIHVGRALTVETAELADAARVLAVENGVPDRNPSGAIAGSGGPTPRVLFLSNMIADKGPLVLVEAVAAVRRRGIPLAATFAGAAGDDRTIAEFHAAVARHGLAEHVHHVGPVFNAAKDELLATHDIFALPTARDAFPLVLLEAMQYGLAVVTTTVGALAEIVVDGETGFLVPPGDVIALADRLARLATRPDLRLRMGSAGRQRYAEHFTFEAFERRFVSALARIIGHDIERAPGGSTRTGEDASDNPSQ